MKFFNTDLYAAPVSGIIGTILIFGLGLLYIEWRRRKAQAAGEGYGVHTTQEPELIDDSTLPNPLLATLPLISVLIVTLILQKVVFPHWNIVDWVSQAPYKMDKAGVIGTMNNWALMIGLAAGILLAFIINPKKIKGNVSKAINAGAIGSLLAVMNTASEVGFGNVIKSLPGFQSIAHSLMNIRGGGSPLISEAVTVNVLAGVTGSASGGMSIALDAFGKDYLAAAQKIGLNPELLHRIASMSSGGMDTLPHNGAVITLLAITGLTHKQAYKDIFVLTLMKMATPFVLIALTSIFHFV